MKMNHYPDKLKSLAAALLLLVLGHAHSIADDGIPLWISVRSRITDAEWEHIAKNYDLVMTLFSPRAGGKDLSAENERVKWIKSLNPKLKIVTYVSSISAANTSLPAWGKPSQHPEWFLKNEKGEWVGDHEYSSIHLDPANPEWREFVAKVASDNISRYGYDGVFVDLVGSTTQYVNHKKTSKTVNPKTGKPYTDEEWKAAELDLLRVLRRHIGDKLMLINSGPGLRYFQTGVADFLTVADGLCNEGFTGWTQDPINRPLIPVDAWKADVDALADCCERGKVALAVANVRKRKPDESAEIFDQRYRFIATSFLLAADQNSRLNFYVKIPGTPEIYIPGDEFLPGWASVSLGEASGPYRRAGGVYQRDFERGKVLVNPVSREVRVPLSGQWKTDSGQAVESSLLMPARTGAILLRGHP